VPSVSEAHFHQITAGAVGQGHGDTPEKQLLNREIYGIPKLPAEEYRPKIRGIAG
jgi:hypothetical protein